VGFLILKIDQLIQRYNKLVVEKNYAGVIKDWESRKNIDKSAQIFNIVGICYKNIGNTQLGISYLEKALVLYPKNSTIYINLGNILVVADNLEAAIENYTKALKYDFDKAYLIYYYRSSVYKKINDFSRFLIDINKSIELNKKFIDSRILKADYYRDNKNFEYANIEYLNILKIDSKNYLALMYLAEQNYKQKNYIESIKNYKAIISEKKFANDFSAHIGIIKNSIITNNLIEAKKHIEILNGLNYNNYELKLIHGYYYERNSQYKVAIEKFNEALDLRSKPYEAYNNLGAIYKILKNLEKSTIYYEKSILIEPNNVVAHLNLANLYLDQGYLPQAYQAFNNALQIDEHNEEVLFWLSQAYIYDNNLNESFKCLIKIKESKNKIFNILSKCYINVINYLNIGEVTQIIKNTEWAELGANDNTFKNSKTYYNLIEKLLATKSLLERKNCENLAVIGESHSLSMSNINVKFNNITYITKAEWIPGIKIFNLLKKQNKYNYLFEKKIQSIKKYSTVLIVIGEIDCRHDAGILKYCLSNNLDIYKYTIDMLTPYIHRIKDLYKNYGFEVIISGVPAPSTNYVKRTSKQELFVKFIEYFNLTLRDLTLKNNFKFLNIYSATIGQNLVAKPECHLDDVHLYPFVYKNAFEQYLEIPACETMKTFLHVGCGPKRKDRTTAGFASWNELRFDIDESVQPDLVGTMTDMSSVSTESVDAVFSSHNIEHLYPHEVPVALSEFLRVLKPDGFAVITCPDLQAVCALVAEDKLTEPAYTSPAGPIAPLDILYGHRPPMARGNLYMAHRCGFTEKVLSATLRSSGFKRVATMKRGAPYFDLWALATKSDLTEEELLQLAKNHFTPR
jgi:tetratricopeptide (TPR) repeat protein